SRAAPPRARSISVGARTRERAGGRAGRGRVAPRPARARRANPPRPRRGERAARHGARAFRALRAESWHRAPLPPAQSRTPGDRDRELPLRLDLPLEQPVPQAEVRDDVLLVVALDQLAERLGMHSRISVDPAAERSRSTSQA